MVNRRALTGTLLLLTACGTQTPAATPSSPVPSPVPSVSEQGPRRSDIRWHGEGDPFNAEVELADGRRVAMHYRRGKGLFEQHYSPRARRWTEPRLVYRTKTEACQGIELRAFDGTVAAIADFGRYCADGEPPMESIAAVGTGDLSTWDHHLTRSFDGWEKISGRAGTVTFERGSSSLRWTRNGGFAG
ncbi:hypothetical protein [Nonomuraea solani]|nr:hypothetical protein [Nonomuraea solani]